LIDGQRERERAQVNGVFLCCDDTDWLSKSAAVVTSASANNKKKNKKEQDNKSICIYTTQQYKLPNPFFGPIFECR